MTIEEYCDTITGEIFWRARIGDLLIDSRGVGKVVFNMHGNPELDKTEMNKEIFTRFIVDFCKAKAA